MASDFNQPEILNTGNISMGCVTDMLYLRGYSSKGAAF
jgi:hypothetical protein